MPWFLYLPMRGILTKGWTALDGGASRTWKVCDAQKGVTEFAKGLCSREGKVGEGFFLVISIARWNQMHIGSVPQKNELVTVH